MKKLLLTACLFLSIGCFAQKSSIIIGVSDGALGNYSSATYFNSDNGGVTPTTDWKAGIGLNLGYQYQFRLSNRFTLQTTALAKVQQGKIDTYCIEDQQVVLHKDKAWIWGASVNGIINYRVWQGLSIGVGVEPTLFFKTDKLLFNEHKQLFDFPLVFKIGYCLKNQMEIAAYYKQGFKSMYDSHLVSHASNSKDIAISLSVPLFKR